MLLKAFSVLIGPLSLAEFYVLTLNILAVRVPRFCTTEDKLLSSLRMPNKCYIYGCSMTWGILFTQDEEPRSIG